MASLSLRADADPRPQEARAGPRPRLGGRRRRRQADQPLRPPLGGAARGAQRQRLPRLVVGRSRSPGSPSPASPSPRRDAPGGPSPSRTPAAPSHARGPRRLRNLSGTRTGSGAAFAGHPRGMHDDLHDRGLAFDLATLRARAGCASRRSPPRAEAARRSRGRGRAGGLQLRRRVQRDHLVELDLDHRGATSTTAAAGGRPVDAIPEETGGPYPGDGSNGPNVLVEDGIVRQDIRSSFGDASGTRRGHPADDRPPGGRRPAAAQRSRGSAVYLWHCTPRGRLLPLLRGRRRRELPPRRAGRRRRRQPQLHLHLPGRLQPSLAAHPLRGVRGPRHRDPRRQPDRHLAARAPRGRLPRGVPHRLATSRASASSRARRSTATWCSATATTASWPPSMATRPAATPPPSVIGV